MKLRDKLRLLRPAAVDGGNPYARSAPDPSAPPVGCDGKSAQSAGQLDRAADAHGPVRPLRIGRDVSLLPVETAAGPVLCAENVYPPTHRHGLMPIGGALQAPSAAWRRLLPITDDFPVEDALFIDLETTGLSRGAGTYAFLIGVGRFTEGGFRVRQFLLRDFHEEPAALAALLDELATARAVITFNGRSFDWPLLESRAVLNRLRLPRLPHLDLLPPARRLWGATLDSCRLGRLEEDVLHVRREDDVPGAEVPKLFFSFLETGDAELLAGVVEHNRLDVLSLAALAGYVALAAADPLRAAPGGRPLSGVELYGFGKSLATSFSDKENADLAGACLEEALRRGLPRPLQRRCRQLLVALHKRAGRAEEAVAVLKAAVAQDGSSPWAHIELAKYYEHRARDFASARDWSLQALDVALRRRALDGVSTSAAVSRDVDAIVHRVRRLERRLRRTSLDAP